MITFKDRWIEQAYQKIHLICPDDDEKEIKKFLSDEFDKDYKDNSCIIYNNYEKDEIETSIYNLFDWIEEKKPILTESGSMFKPHSQSFNPNAIILGKKLAERKIEKKKKFKYLDMANATDDPKEKDEYNYLAKKADLAQLRHKVIANSEYGVSGLPSSWFFNMACASATTARGQALISTAFNAFEDFLCDNVLFESMDECLIFINNIIKEKKNRKKNDEKWVENKTTSEVVDRIVNKFEDPNTCDKDIIKRIVKNLSQEDKNRIYYKSNIYEFFRNSKKARQLLKNIVQDSHNFLNPDEPPKYIGEQLDKLRPAVLEYVHYNHPTPNRVQRLKTHTRKCVIVIDTDSNFINLYPWVEFVYNEIVNGYVNIGRRKKIDGRYIISASNPDKKYSRKAKEKETFRIIYTMVNMTTCMINDTMRVFEERSNVEKEHPGVLAMKNEFLYDSILVTPAKKHYQSAVRVQEGVYFEKPKFDIKGMEYTKNSMAGESTREFIKKLVYKDILLPEGGVPDVAKILKKLKKFENKIKKSVIEGGDEYLKTANIKTEDAYDDPMSIGNYKAAYVWNTLYPDKQIELPGIAKIVKVNLSKPKDFAQLSVTEPEIFEKLMYLFNNNKRIAKSGINNIAIPLDVEFPKWIIPFINMDEIIGNNVRLILSILNCLGVKTVYKTKSTQFFSNVIKL